MPGTSAAPLYWVVSGPQEFASHFIEHLDDVFTIVDPGMEQDSAEEEWAVYIPRKRHCICFKFEDNHLLMY